MSREHDRLIASLAGRQAGRVARRQLLAAGISPRSITRRAEYRRLFPVLPGVYAVSLAPAPRSRLWEAWLYGGPEACLTHRAAASLWRIGDFRLLDLTLPANRRGCAHVICHRGSIPHDQRTTRFGLPVSIPSRTLLDLAAIVRRPRLQPVFTEAEVRGLVDQAANGRILEAHPGRPGSPLFRSLAGIESGPVRRGRVRSPHEVAFRSLIESSSLPRPEFNVRVAAGECFYEVDALWRARRVVAEVDVRSTHEPEERFDSDRERDMRLSAHGWRVARVTPARLARPGSLLEDLGRLLARGATA